MDKYIEFVHKLEDIFAESIDSDSIISFIAALDHMHQVVSGALVEGQRRAGKDHASRN